MSVSAIARTISPAILCAACLVLAGCGKKDFDQQYSDKEKQLAAEQSRWEAFSRAMSLLLAPAKEKLP